MHDTFIDAPEKCLHPNKQKIILQKTMFVRASKYTALIHLQLGPKFLKLANTGTIYKYRCIKIPSLHKLQVARNLLIALHTGPRSQVPSFSPTSVPFILNCTKATFAKSHNE